MSEQLTTAELVAELQRRLGKETSQLSKNDLAGMSPEEVSQADRDGRLQELKTQPPKRASS